MENAETLRKKKAALKEQLKQNNLSQDSFEEDNDKFLFYAGLPNWTLVLGIFNFVKGMLISPFQKFLMTIIRLRLNLSGRDLVYRFGGISASTVSRTFRHVAGVLYQRLKPLIIWPDSEVLRQTLPKDFRKYCPNCVVIYNRLFRNFP